MSVAFNNLLSTLDLETLEENSYRGDSAQKGWRHVFGGLVIAQALMAATRTVQDRKAHSLHCYFLRAGDKEVPIVYDVERIRDGKSFTTRRVVAIQHERPIFFMSASFHKEEPGLSHQIKMPKVPMPEDLPNEDDIKKQFMSTLPPQVQAFWQRERPVDIKFTDFSRFLGKKPLEAKQNIWIRAKGEMPDNEALHKSILCYASDFFLLDTALIAHGRTVFDPSLMMASLDHALWFHKPFRADEWLLYSQDSPSSGGARGFCRGSIFDRQGNLIASVVQEGLIRERD